MKTKLLIGILFLVALQLNAQKTELSLQGELSAHSSYSFEQDLEALAGARYLPQLNLKIPVDSTRFLDFEAGANLYASSMFHPFDTFVNDGGIKPYRIWARYSGKQYEVRLGLQKISFGSATLLRPLQWFDQIDPRDPLRFTNGVYGVLGRYYFKNNANIWLWGLYGNEDPRGLEIFSTRKQSPELGGRYQHPVPKGELALSYHYREIDLSLIPDEWVVPEHKMGIDGKWDVGVGLWFEASHALRKADQNPLAHQSMLNLGTDYTFGIGNGLNLVAEHLMITSDQKPLTFKQNANISALMASYPLGFFDNLSLMGYYAWEAEGYAAFINYQHSFKYITTYLIVFYSAGIDQSVVEGNIANSYSGPGIQLMLVYNH